VSRIVEWYLRCAEALARLDPYSVGHRHVQIELAAQDAPHGGFVDYDQAIAWFHDERANLTAVVSAALKAGLKKAAWQIPALLRQIYDRERVFDDWFAATSLGLEAARSLGSDDGLAYLLESLGRAYFAQHAMTRAMECYAELLELCRARGDHFAEAVTLNAMGLVEIRRHHMAEAIAHFEHCGALCAEYGLRELTVNPATNLAQAFLEFGRPDESLTMGHEAVETNRGVGSKQAEMYALLRLSAAELETGDPMRADTWIEQARVLAEASHSRAEEGVVLLYAGPVYLALGRTGEALEAFQKSALIARRWGDRQREALSLRGVGLVHRSEARHQDALDVQRSVVLAWRSLGDRWQIALSLADVIRDLDSEGREESRSAATEALGLIEDFTDPAADRLRAFLTHASTNLGD
jgi:tetratricopeptide (TPR) repeat protein